MEEDVTVVDESNCDAILAAAPDILDLFGVRVERLNAVKDGDFMFNNNSVSESASQTSDDLSLSVPDGPQPCNGDTTCIILRLAAIDGERAADNVSKAKTYMRCLTCDESQRRVHRVRYDTDAYPSLQEHSKTVARQTQAVVSCDYDTGTVTISGLPDNVAMAIALTNQAFSNVSLSPLGGSGKDDRTCETTTTRPAMRRHQGLSRTVSGNCNTASTSQSDSAVIKKKALCRTQTLQEELSTAQYADKVRFAVKLGYTEDQLRCVLDKCGWHVAHNDLLSELVQLGSLESDSENEEPCDLNRSGHSDGEVKFIDLDRRRYSDDCSESEETDKLRPIVIDGSNVAMSHGSKKVFSCQGIKLAVMWFRQRGHTEITVFVPQWRKETSRPDTQITGQEILLELEKEKVLVFTPARRVCGKRIICYDDRYIIKLAAENGGVVVSNDNYRDLINESTSYKKVIEERLLMYSFVNDRFMPPDDPLGRRGPSLDNFLQVEPLLPETLPPTCPYGNKCTYGNKCRYYHPERGLQPHKSVLEKLAERADKHRLAARGHTVASPTSSVAGVSGQKAVTAKMPAKRALMKTRSLVTGGGSSKNPLVARNSTCCCGVNRGDDHGHGDGLEPLDTGVPKNVTSPDDLDMSQMKVSVTVTESDRFERSRDASTGLCRRTERVEKPVERMQASGDATRYDAELGNFATHDLPQSVMARQLAGDYTQVAAPWTSSSHALLPSCSDPALLQYDLGGGHLSLARKLSDDTRLSDDEPPQRRMLSHGVSLGSGQPTQHNHWDLQQDLSLRGAEDLQFSSTEGATRQLQQQPQADWFNEANSAEKWFVSNSARSSPQPEIQMAAANDAAGFRRRRSCGKVNQYDLLHQFRADHSPLNRNRSAPVAKATTLLYPRGGGGATMQRQSSTSDPLLHPKDDGPSMIEATPGGYVATPPPPVSCSFSAENYQRWSPVYHRPAPTTAPNVTSLGANHQIKVAFTPLGQQQSFQTAQRFVDPHASLVGRGPTMDPYVSFMPNHMMLQQRQPEVMMQYANVAPRVHEPVNAHHQHMIPNLNQPPPSYQVAPPAATVSDKRRNLYFHLCGLFPEERVTQVMLQHPTETNPQILCAYLIRITNN